MRASVICETYPCHCDPVFAPRTGHRHFLPAQRTVRGLTLIEILVTMVLLGVGLLGLAGLQLRGMQVNQGSTFRSQAAILAEDIADRLRADVITAQAQGYDGNWIPNAPPPQPAVAGLVADWLYRMQSLPSACANVTTTVQPPAASQPQPTSIFTITITWDDTRANRAANAAATAPANAACTPGAGSGSYILTTE